MAVAAVAILSLPTFAQQPVPKPSFEVVSIRPGSMTPASCAEAPIRAIGMTCGGPGTSDPERFTGNSTVLRSLMQRAYGVQAFQVIGPDWIGAARYDVNAKVPPGASKDDFNRMLQNLLEDRFKMKVHHETREFPAYNLALAKGGLRLKESVSIDACASGGRPVGKTCPEGASYISGIAKSAPDARGGTIMTSPPRDGTGNLVTGRGVKLAGLANMLQNQLRGSVVADQTGLTDTYDFRFEFSPPDVGTAGDFSAPSLFTALEKELGLKLEATKTQLDCIVIDHIEQPSEN